MKQRIVWDCLFRMWVPLYAGIPDPYIAPRDIADFCVQLNRLNKRTDDEYWQVPLLG